MLTLLSRVAFTLLLGTAVSSNITCKDGQEIKTRPLPSNNSLAGKWSYSYHWGKYFKYIFEFMNQDEDHVLDCPQFEIDAIKPELVEEQNKKCIHDPIPFEWEDAVWRLSAPLIGMENAIFIMGKETQWLFVDCAKFLQAVALEGSEDVIVLINPEDSTSLDMITREALQLSELKCIAHNVGIAKGIEGISLCF